MNSPGDLDRVTPPAPPPTGSPAPGSPVLPVPQAPDLRTPSSELADAVRVLRRLIPADVTARRRAFTAALDLLTKEDR